MDIDKFCIRLIVVGQQHTYAKTHAQSIENSMLGRDYECVII